MLDALLKRPALLGCRASRANAQLGGGAGLGFAKRFGVREKIRLYSPMGHAIIKWCGKNRT